MSRFPAPIVLLLALCGGAVGAVSAQAGHIEWQAVSNGQRLDVLRFYVSGTIFCLGSDTVGVDPTPRLIDLAEGPFKTPYICNATMDRLSFQLGIDSATNVQGVLGGDLDPTLGMYWTWQSGYINFKLETRIGAEDNQYHLGGYRWPFQTLRTVTLDIRSEQPSIVFSVDEFLASVPDSLPRKIMSPGSAASILSDCAMKSFHAE